MSQARLAELANTTQQQISRLEKMDEGIPLYWARKLAPFLECEPEDLMIAPRMVPIVGRVGAGAEVFPIDDFAMGEGLGEVRCPPGMNPHATVAVQVVGNSMYPEIDEGWLLFYSRTDEFIAGDVIGRRCVVKLADDGPTLVKRVVRGPTRGRFNLQSLNAPHIEDVELEWAAPVRWTMAPNDAG